MSAFLALKLMAERNQDIASCNNFVEARMTKGGGHIVMGVDGVTLSKVIHSMAGKNDYIVCLFVINADQFEKAKAEVEADERNHPG